MPTGGHYVDSAVMAPVPPQRLAVPMLLSAPRAAEALPALRSLGFNASVISAQEVLASLAQTFPQMGWEDALPDYLVSRVAEHGRRRAAEMREVVRTLEDAGLEPRMALATSQRQEELVEAMGSQRIDYPRDRAFSWRALADALAKEGSR